MPPPDFRRGVGRGGGGGGRIAVWCGQPWTENTNVRRITISGTPLEGEKFAPFFEWAGTVSVDGGVTLGDYANANNNGEDGTVRFCHVSMPPGVMITIW